MGLWEHGTCRESWKTEGGRPGGLMSEPWGGLPREARLAAEEAGCRTCRGFPERSA